MHVAFLLTNKLTLYGGLGINCYQCASATEWECGDGQLVMEKYQPKSCDHIFEAQYCIKSIGTYGGSYNINN